MTGILYAKKPIALFLAAGYEEATAVYYLEQLRKAGLPVSLIGINDQPIRGRHGINLLPDSTIATLPSDIAFHIILISGGCQHVNSMLIDPRIHKLLHKTINAHGFIAPLPNIESIFLRSGFSHDKFSPHIIKQGAMNANKYINHLIHLAESSASTVTKATETNIFS